VTALASNRALLSAQRELFQSEFAQEIKERGEDYWQFPYTILSKALVAYEQTRFGLIGDRDAKAYVGEGAWKSFKAAHKNMRSHFTSTLTAARGGKLICVDGETPFTAQVDGDVLEVELSEVIAGLDMSGFTMQDLFEDETDANLFLANRDGLLGAGRRLLRKERWNTTLVWHSELDSGEERVWTPSAGDLFVVMYLVLHTLCSRFGCGQSLRELFERRRRTSHPKTKAAKTSFLANDDASRRLFGRGDDCLTQADYLCGKPVGLYANNKRGMTLRIETDMSLDDAFEAYRLDFEDQFWHEMVWTLACNDGNEPLTTIRGSDIIRQAGYSNPYCDSALPLYARSLKRIDKLMTANRVAIETDPTRNKPEGVTSSYMLQPIIDGKPELLSFEDASTDYVIHLNVPAGGSALDALPLARFATETGEVIRAMRRELEFPGMRLNFEHRMMWRYCLQRAKQRRANRKILFTTMFRNIGLGDAERHKKARMITMLRKMLDERQSGGQLTYQWHVEDGEKSAYGVTIHLEERNALPEEEKASSASMSRDKRKD
jgi:hypothetical protein